MAPRPKTVGGGQATPLANDFYDFLRQGLNTGTFGNSQMNSADPMASTKGIAGILNDILSSGGGKLGGGLGAMIARQNANNVANLRARFGAGGGTSSGTPGAYAEASYNAQHAEDAPVAIGQLQLSALQPLLSLISGASAIGTPQAQTVMQQSDLAAGLQGLAAVGGAAVPLLRPNPFGNPGASAPVTTSLPYDPSNVGNANVTSTNPNPWANLLPGGQ